MSDASIADVLRDPATIRARAHHILAAVRADHSPHFRVRDDLMSAAARTVADVTRQRYPTLAIPVHARWRHFEAGGVDRLPRLAEALKGVDRAERARAEIDLTVVSVLLDAGAGPDWMYREAYTGIALGRSEGLGLATFHAFIAGWFSSDNTWPLRADAGGLLRLDEAALRTIFQVSAGNPLVGQSGRAALMQRLGTALGDLDRPGAMFDALTDSGRNTSVAAADILRFLLEHFSTIWPSNNTIGDVAVGDCWPHPHAGGSGATAGWMPFHKLSQWLTYSLIEPFERAGVRVVGLDALTALPEYRNGGLLLDAGVIEPRAAHLLTQSLRAGDEAIVEWRALTVALIDELAPMIRTLLGKREDELPLAALLEGGTWAAGRALAAQHRGGLPPLNIVSDGTVF
jgi:hypothetical protein